MIYFPDNAVRINQHLILHKNMCILNQLLYVLNQCLTEFQNPSLVTLINMININRINHALN